jgi:CheY-like chemotaxis protein/nitrogen-specific signal transduction histidine kinase
MSQNPIEIDNLKKQIKALEQREAEAVNANRMKSEQIAAISHDIRTSMGAIISTSELLLGTNLDETQRRYAKTVFGQAQSLMDILNQILDLSKLEAGRFELEQIDFAPAGILHSVSDAMQSRIADKNLTLKTNISQDLPEFVNADPTQIRRAMFNLVDNAIKFTSSGVITLHLDAKKQREKWLLKFAVEDTGIGLDPDEQARLFNPYQQADPTITRNFGGTGLGLSLVQKLASHMGGEAGVTSRKHEGSTFWFTVLCSAAQNQASTGQASGETGGPAPISARSANILVAEDNHINRMLITTYLEKFGHRFNTANNGIEALKAARQGNFDLILMDIHMPEMDGLEATRAIRKLAPPHGETPIIALTANAMKGDREKYIEAGMDEYVSKPINAADLYAKINALVNRRKDVA